MYVVGLFVCVWTHACKDVHAHIYLWVWRPKVDIRHHLQYLFYLAHWGSLWINPSSHQDGQSCSGGPCLPSTSQDWDYRWVAMPTQYLHGFWVSDLQYSCSCVKHVSFGSIFPASELLLLKNILHSLNRIPQNTPFSNQVTGNCITLGIGVP